MTSLADGSAGKSTPVVAEAQPSQAPAQRRYVPLLHRVAGINAVLVIAAVAVTIVVLAPGKVSALALDEELIVVLVAVVLVVLTNVYLVRRVVGPLQALTAFVRQVDYSTLGQRMPGAEPTSEAGELALTFNQMLERLQAERRESTGRVLRRAGGRAAADRAGVARPGRPGADRGPARTVAHLLAGPALP
jgi:HAMP domain-containing protein